MTDVSSKPRGSKVRAVLCKGQGWVQLVPERYQAVNNEDGAQEVRHFLETLGYCKGKAYLAPACAKFWVTNETPGFNSYQFQFLFKELNFNMILTIQDDCIF